jgi:putative nucleotidyltransferase with HDIG domain
VIIDPKIRKGVIESLPEAKQIKNLELRDKVYDAWAMALKDSGYTKIEEMPPSGNPAMQPLRKGTQTDHFRCVARVAAAIAQDFNTNFDLNVDMDEVIAGALCHDLGKPFEYANQERWKANPGAAGNPSIRHPAYGVYIALSAGLPETIAHIAGGHAIEGEIITRSVAGTIVSYADHAFWAILTPEELKKAMKNWRSSI